MIQRSKNGIKCTEKDLTLMTVQAYLPERSSQLIDVITNSSGTAVGVYLWYRYINLSR